MPRRPLLSAGVRGRRLQQERVQVVPAHLARRRPAQDGAGAGNARGSHVYFMLHGSDADATRFWGENNSGVVEAVNISNIPRRFAGVVFTVAGADKREPLARVKRGDDVPAARVRAARVIWLVDDAANG